MLVRQPSRPDLARCGLNGTKPGRTAMNRCRLQVFYSGTVQGVGFRYSVKMLASGFEVAGTVRNVPDGRVELVVEGADDELKAFQQAIRESELGHFIRKEDVHWHEAQGAFRGFEIVG
jgi:acylphosphatase